MMLAKLKDWAQAMRRKTTAYALARWPEKSTLMGLGASLGTSTATIAALNLPADFAKAMAVAVIVVGLMAAFAPTTPAAAAAAAVDPVQS